MGSGRCGRLGGRCATLHQQHRGVACLVFATTPTGHQHFFVTSPVSTSGQHELYMWAGGGGLRRGLTQGWQAPALRQKSVRFSFDFRLIKSNVFPTKNRMFSPLKIDHFSTIKSTIFQSNKGSFFSGKTFDL